ncbi:hypothetical protein KGY79_10705 [Candidatus Bipolaricaulota bacterium]|nr:hypothetical protein [Candidatus Bipolaricaulota bacterium]
MVRSSTANKLSPINQINHSSYIINLDRTTETDKDFSTGGRKGEPAEVSGSKGGNSVIGFVEFLGFMGLTTKNPTNPMNSISSMNQDRPPAEAFRSCDLFMEEALNTKDRQATKGGL